MLGRFSLVLLVACAPPTRSDRQPLIGAGSGIEAHPAGFVFTPFERPQIEGSTELPALPLPDPPACLGTGTALFKDVSSCAGLSLALDILPTPTSALDRFSTGQAWLDVDGDTWLDLVTTSHQGWNRLFRGSSSGVFTEVVDAGLWDLPATSAVAGDYDGDGDLDLFLGGRDTDWLLENDGGVFVTPAGDLPTDPRYTAGASFADVDLDGQLELFASNYSCLDCPVGAFEQNADSFYRQGPTGWEDVLDLSFDPMLSCGLGFIGVWADFDSDGDSDLFVSNDRGRDQPDSNDGLTLRTTYWRNDGPGCDAACFAEIGRENGAALFIDAMGVDAGDYDGDGDLDVVVTDTFDVVLLENDGTGRFFRVPWEPDMDSDGWGVLFLDHDNDGDLDLFVAQTTVNRFFRNDGGVYVDDSEAVVGLATGMTRGAALADYDRDGRLDVVVGDSGGAYRLLRNSVENDNNWVGLRLVGSGPGGTSALGARVTVRDTDGVERMRELKSGSSIGAGSDLGAHIGLGSAELDQVVITWPDGVEEEVEVLLNRWTVVAR